MSTSRKKVANYRTYTMDVIAAILSVAKYNAYCLVNFVEFKTIRIV